MKPNDFSQLNVLTEADFSRRSMLREERRGAAAGQPSTCYPLTLSHERRRVGLKTMSFPKNPDFYHRTGNLEIVRRRSAFLTLILESHFYSLASEHPQHGSFERTTSGDSGRCWHAPGGTDKDKMICHLKVRFALNRPECFRAFDGDWGEYRMSGEKGDHARFDVKMNIPLN